MSLGNNSFNLSYIKKGDLITKFGGGKNDQSIVTKFYWSWISLILLPKMEEVYTSEKKLKKEVLPEDCQEASESTVTN